jgi:hypothetical protein
LKVLDEDFPFSGCSLRPLLEVQIEKDEDGSSVAYCIPSKALHIIVPVPSKGVMMQKNKKTIATH